MRWEVKLCIIVKFWASVDILRQSLQRALWWVFHHAHINQCVRIASEQRHALRVTLQRFNQADKGLQQLTFAFGCLTYLSCLLLASLSSISIFYALKSSCVYSPASLAFQTRNSLNVNLPNKTLRSPTLIRLGNLKSPLSQEYTLDKVFVAARWDILDLIEWELEFRGLAAPRRGRFENCCHQIATDSIWKAKFLSKETSDTVYIWKLIGVCEGVRAIVNPSDKAYTRRGDDLEKTLYVFLHWYKMCKSLGCISRSSE